MKPEYNKRQRQLFTIVAERKIAEEVKATIKRTLKIRFKIIGK